LWLSVSSVVALACGWAAARIVYTELAQSRREAASDRAAQAKAYKSMFALRAVEHAEFTTSMTDRLARRDKDVEELEATIVLAEQRAMEAESRVKREARRANEAQEKIAELQQRFTELEARAAEENDELASWGADLGAELDTVVDLLAWEEKVTVSGQAASEENAQKHA
jgi:succinate dehydrogenase/fumarate reductase flavoprotein subunit